MKNEHNNPKPWWDGTPLIQVDTTAGSVLILAVNRDVRGARLPLALASFTFEGVRHTVCVEMPPGQFEASRIREAVDASIGIERAKRQVREEGRAENT
jgi:hypothetical protein